MLCAREKIDAPFCVINADDFYGRTSFESIAQFLTTEASPSAHAMVGYRIENTLTENGHVARGICQTDEHSMLVSVTERTHIEPREGGAAYTEDGEHFTFVPAGTYVSMNMWGFTPDYMDFSARLFARFLAERGHELKSEFYIPTVVNEAIRCGAAKVKVLDTDASWFGVTYAAD